MTRTVRPTPRGAVLAPRAERECMRLRRDDAKTQKLPIVSCEPGAPPARFYSQPTRSGNRKHRRPMSRLECGEENGDTGSPVVVAANREPGASPARFYPRFALTTAGGTAAKEMPPAD